jgi:hypothetical protein
VEDLSAHPLQVAGALGLLKVPEEPSAVQADRSAHLPAVVILLAETVMGAAVRSDAAVVEVALEVSPVVIPLEAFPAAASQVAMVGVAEAADKSWQIH